MSLAYFLSVRDGSNIYAGMVTLTEIKPFIGDRDKARKVFEDSLETASLPRKPRAPNLLIRTDMGRTITKERSPRLGYQYEKIPNKETPTTRRLRRHHLTSSEWQCHLNKQPHCRTLVIILVATPPLCLHSRHEFRHEKFLYFFQKRMPSFRQWYQNLNGFRDQLSTNLKSE